MSQPNNTSQKSDSAQTLRFKVTRHEIVEVPAEPNSEYDQNLKRIAEIEISLDKHEQSNRQSIMMIAQWLGCEAAAQTFLSDPLVTREMIMGYYFALVDVKFNSTSNQAA